MKRTPVKYIAVRRDGRRLGNSYMHRVYISICGIDADGKRVYVGHTPYLRTAGYWAEHMTSGMNKADKAEFAAKFDEYKRIAEKMTQAIN